MENSESLEGHVWEAYVVLSEDYQNRRKEMKLEAGKFYRTYGGYRVRIYATDAGDSYPVHGAVAQSDGTWEQQTWTASGKFNIDKESSSFDIVAEWEEPKPMKLYRYKLTGSLHLLEKVDRPEDYEEVHNEQLKRIYDL